MRIRAKVLFCVFVAGLFSLPVSFAGDTTRYTGMFLLERCEISQRINAKEHVSKDEVWEAIELLAYIRGFTEGSSILVGEKKVIPWDLEGVSTEQIALVLHKYLKEHLNELHKPANLLLARALLENFERPDFKVPSE